VSQERDLQFILVKWAPSPLNKVGSMDPSGIEPVTTRTKSKRANFLSCPHESHPYAAKHLWFGPVHRRN